MGTLYTFRPRPVAPAPVPPSPAETRRLIEEAAQAALDTADALLAILDRMDGDTDREDSADAEPSLADPVVGLRQHRLGGRRGTPWDGSGTVR